MSEPSPTPPAKPPPLTFNTLLSDNRRIGFTHLIAYEPADKVKVVDELFKTLP